MSLDSHGGAAHLFTANLCISALTPALLHPDSLAHIPVLSLNPIHTLPTNLCTYGQSEIRSGLVHVADSP